MIRPRPVFIRRQANYREKPRAPQRPQEIDKKTSVKTRNQKLPQRFRRGGEGRKAIQSEGSEEMGVCTGEWVVVERGGERERRTIREAGGGRREAGGRERGAGGSLDAETPHQN